MPHWTLQSLQFMTVVCNFLGTTTPGSLWLFSERRRAEFSFEKPPKSQLISNPDMRELLNIRFSISRQPNHWRIEIWNKLVAYPSQDVATTKSSLWAGRRQPRRCKRSTDPPSRGLNLLRRCARIMKSASSIPCLCRRLDRNYRHKNSTSTWNNKCVKLTPCLAGHSRTSLTLRPVEADSPYLPSPPALPFPNWLLHFLKTGVLHIFSAYSLILNSFLNAKVLQVFYRF